MSELYIEKEEQKQRIWYKRSTEMLSVPQDYFDQMKQKLGTEFHQTYVEKNTYSKFCGAIVVQLESLKMQISLLNERLEKMEKPEIEEMPQEFRVIPEEEATEKIVSFVNNHPGARTSDIICDLGLDPNLTIKILHKLRDEQKITGK